MAPIDTVSVLHFYATYLEMHFAQKPTAHTRRSQDRASDDPCTVQRREARRRSAEG